MDYSEDDANAISALTSEATRLDIWFSSYFKCIELNVGAEVKRRKQERARELIATQYQNLQIAYSAQPDHVKDVLVLKDLMNGLEEK